METDMQHRRLSIDELLHQSHINIVNFLHQPSAEAIDVLRTANKLRKELLYITYRINRKRLADFCVNEVIEEYNNQCQEFLQNWQERKSKLSEKIKHDRNQKILRATQLQQSKFAKKQK